MLTVTKLKLPASLAERKNKDDLAASYNKLKPFLKLFSLQMM